MVISLYYFVKISDDQPRDILTNIYKIYIWFNYIGIEILNDSGILESTLFPKSTPKSQSRLNTKIKCVYRCIYDTMEL